jgi:adenosylcobinamide-phosphate guanylyltransferase
MQALINAGGKGTRMGHCGIEKPMQVIGGKPSILRVIEALEGSEHLNGILVSVSDNTPDTESFLTGIGVPTIRTSGESFVDDLHEAFGVMTGDFILTCPSDTPLLSPEVIDRFIASFDPERMESHVALVCCDIVRGLGITPSFVMDRYGSEWAVSGLTIMNRLKTLNGDYLLETFYHTDDMELAVNVNTRDDLVLARGLMPPAGPRKPVYTPKMMEGAEGGDGGSGRL